MNLPVIVVRSSTNRRHERKDAHLVQFHLIAMIRRGEEEIPILPLDEPFLAECRAKCGHKLVAEDESVPSVFSH